MEPLERVAVLLTLMRELEGVMRQENALLREMKLARLADLQTEKAALAEAYETELRSLRSAPEAVASLPTAVRQSLEQATREFQLTARSNVNALLAGRAERADPDGDDLVGDRGGALLVAGSVGADDGDRRQGGVGGLVERQGDAGRPGGQRRAVGRVAAGQLAVGGRGSGGDEQRREGGEHGEGGGAERGAG